ncbi:MAG TPA: SIMPL domain-containing protein [Novosphingobium sp.]|nr:SIMPL domain-containing protein [Novosphingobium sp.]
MLQRLLVFGAALALTGCSEDPPNPLRVDHDETLLSLSASGEAEAVPDVAVIEIGVESFAATAKAASETNARKSADIAAGLKEYGAEAKDVQTRNLSLNRVTYGPKKGQFQSSNILSVRLHDVVRAGEAVAAATTAGANVLSGPSLQISDPEKANRGAYIAAYRAAKTRAEAYAEAAGMEIGRVLSIRDGGQDGGNPYAYGAVEAADAAARVMPPMIAAPPPPAIMPGTSRTRVSVQVDFALTEK